MDQFERLNQIDLAAKTLEAHQIEWVSYEDGYVCGCDDRGELARMPFLSDALKHQAAQVLAALPGTPPAGEGEG